MTTTFRSRRRATDSQCCRHLPSCSGPSTRPKSQLWVKCPGIGHPTRDRSDSPHREGVRGLVKNWSDLYPQLAALHQSATRVMDRLKALKGEAKSRCLSHPPVQAEWVAFSTPRARVRRRQRLSPRIFDARGIRPTDRWPGASCPVPCFAVHPTDAGVLASYHSSRRTS